MIACKVNIINCSSENSKWGEKIIVRTDDIVLEFSFGRNEFICYSFVVLAAGKTGAQYPCLNSWTSWHI